MKNFEYAKDRKEKRYKKPWYLINTKQYSFYIWVAPVVPICILIEKYKKWAYNRLQWDVNTAKSVLDYTLPYVLEYDQKDNYYYYDRDIWLPDKAPRKYKAWASKFYTKLQSYLANEYQKEGYKKVVIGKSENFSNFYDYVEFYKVD